MAATNTNDTQKDEHRRLFDERMAIAVSTKRDNSPYLSQEEYATIRDAMGDSFQGGEKGPGHQGLQLAEEICCGGCR